MNFEQLVQLEQEHKRVGKRIEEAIEASRKVGGIVGDIKGRMENSSLKRALLDFRKLASQLTKRQ